MDTDLVMAAYHNHRLVVLSIVISILAAYAARALTGRVRDARGRVWLTWLVIAATVDGIGTWSMHYTGKLALRLPVPLLFDWSMVLLSLLVSIIGSAAALLVLSRSHIGWPRAVVASIFLGLGISGLHYTAMAGVIFLYSATATDLSHAVSISSLGILGISIVPVLVLIVALLTTTVDRLQKQRTLLDELFEQASQAVALMSADFRVVRVNREFTQLFGYSPKEAIGR
jgi:NO-binding membrane sensor protein with MHYT domain